MVPDTRPLHEETPGDTGLTDDERTRAATTAVRLVAATLEQHSMRRFDE